MTGKCILLIASGEAPSKKLLDPFLKNEHILIAADGGANSCKKLDLYPHYIVGDFDSIHDKTRAHFSNSIYVELADQNFCDLHKAIEFCSTLQPTELILFGLSGKRSDHQLNNFMVLSTIQLPCKVRALDDFGSFTILEPGSHQLEGKAGQAISFLSFTPITGLTLTGAQYPLHNKDFAPLFNGSSNAFKESNVTVQFTTGRLLVYLPFEKSDQNL